MSRWLAMAVLLAGCSGATQPDASDVVVDSARPDVVIAVDAQPDVQRDVQADVQADVQQDTPPVDTGVDAEPDVTPPPPVDAGATRCLVSADCPSGTHCDLAQCVQDCSTGTACSSGTTCSARARCLARGVLDQDTPPTPLPVLLSVTPSVVSLDPGVTAFDFTLSATGHVAFRVEPSEPWLNVAISRGEFDNTLTVHATVDPAMIPSGTNAANVLVYSSAGNGLVAVRIPPAVDGTYRGALTYDSIVMPTFSPLGTTTPTAMGSTQFAIWVHSDGTVRARIDPDHSLVWPSSTTGPAEGSGTLTAGTGTAPPHLDLRLFQLLDSTAVQPLFGLETPVAVASPLPAQPIGRELLLSLNAGPGGTLNGTVTERIHGLSASPIEMRGTARLTWMIGVAAPAITLGPVPTMPGGPSRTVGIQPAGCALLPTGAGQCSLTATPTERAACLLGHMNRAFGLHTFYAPTLAPAHYTSPAASPSSLFALPPSGTLGAGGANPYTGTRTACQSDLGTDLRTDRDSSTGGQGCVNPSEMQCTRWLAGTLFPPFDTLMRYQYAFNVARAWSELYLLVGNQSLVDAIAASTTGLDPTVS
ncbi:MAG: hypothetical protein WCJ30_21145, partial [Deltaproteobacteria bacterium]